jgi:aspartate/methionine/tyrosine aminotransferase
LKGISKNAQKIDGQPMFQMLEEIKKLEKKGKDIIHFEIGDPDFKTPMNIIRASYRAMINGYTHYVSSYGLEEFRKEICKTTKISRGFLPDINQVLVTPGANIVMYYAILCLVDPGKEVIVPDPGFPTYYSAIKMCNAKSVRVPLKEKNDFRMSPKDIESKITSKTRLIIINSPQNPTGAVMTKEELKQTYEIAEKYDLYLYSDEIYDKMVYGGLEINSPSIYDKCKKRVILSTGFSKSFAMTGWRLGTVIAPKVVIDKMNLLLETTSSCVSPFIQKAGIEAISGDQRKIKQMMKEYQKRRDVLVDGLNSISNIECLKPDGAFYVFANIKKTGKSSEEIARFLLKDANIAVLPGTNFGKYGEGYIRLCYATSLKNINLGIKRINKSMRKINE